MQLDTNTVEQTHQTTNIYTPDSPSIQKQPKSCLQQAHRKCGLFANDQARQIRPVVVRMNHEKTQGGAGLPEVRLQTRQVAPEDVQSLLSQPYDRPPIKPRLRIQEFQV